MSCCWGRENKIRGREKGHVNSTGQEKSNTSGKEVLICFVFSLSAYEVGHLLVRVNAWNEKEKHNQDWSFIHYNVNSVFLGVRQRLTLNIAKALSPPKEEASYRSIHMHSLLVY
jgi:hypothetical protein